MRWYSICCFEVMVQQILTVITCPSVFSFLDNNLSKYQWIFITLGMCLDIVEIWLGIANGQIS